MTRCAAFLAALLVLTTPSQAVTIRDDPGGDVIAYVQCARQIKTARFDGLCASACTLYLAVRDKCVTPRARFAFHRAYGADPRVNEIATRHMMKSYPAWVRRWIAAHGGLSSKLIVMSNSYARKHMKAC